MAVPMPPQATTGVGSTIVSSVGMNYETIEGTLIDAMLDALPYGYDSPTFGKLTRLLIAIRAQREMRQTERLNAFYGEPVFPPSTRIPE